jgi:hypothetical protein
MLREFRQGAQFLRMFEPFISNETSVAGAKERLLCEFYWRANVWSLEN